MPNKKQIVARCPLCSDSDYFLFHEDKFRPYLNCETCHLVFVPESYRLSVEDEKAEYDLHQNDQRDEGYREFLSRLSKPLLEQLSANSHGLDFGCGPGPALSVMLEEKGHTADLYDPFYYPDESVLNNSFDFICATEVVEHLRDPFATFTRLFAMLKPGGWLAIMTKLARDQKAFSRWHYIRDRTHICFYRQDSFAWLAHRFNASIFFADSDVIMLQKKSESS